MFFMFFIGKLVFLTSMAGLLTLDDCIASGPVQYQHKLNVMMVIGGVA